jgi:hypothetical protein
MMNKSIELKDLKITEMTFLCEIGWLENYENG